MIDTLLEAIRLKSLDRAGWVRAGTPEVESVAAHSWGVSWLVLALCPPELNRERALAYAVIHDLPEVRVGDLTPHDGVLKADKQAREHEALLALTAPLPSGGALRALFADYECRADAEARFVKQLDKLDMALTAVVYAELGAEGMHEFLDSAEQGIDHPALKPIMAELRARISPEAS